MAILKEVTPQPEVITGPVSRFKPGTLVTWDGMAYVVARVVGKYYAINLATGGFLNAEVEVLRYNGKVELWNEEGQ